MIWYISLFLDSIQSKNSKKNSRRRENKSFSHFKPEAPRQQQYVPKNKSFVDKRPQQRSGNINHTTSSTAGLALNNSSAEMSFDIVSEFDGLASEGKKHNVAYLLNFNYVSRENYNNSHRGLKGEVSHKRINIRKYNKEQYLQAK